MVTDELKLVHSCSVLLIGSLGAMWTILAFLVINLLNMKIQCYSYH